MKKNRFFSWFTEIETGRLCVQVSMRTLIQVDGMSVPRYQIAFQLPALAGTFRISKKKEKNLQLHAGIRAIDSNKKKNIW